MSANSSIQLRLEPAAARYHQMLLGVFPQLMPLKRYLARTDICTLAAWCADELVGVSLFRPFDLNGERALLSMFSYVCPGFRGQGLNGRFKRFVETQARLQGITLAVAHVRAGNQASMRSLQRSGYRRHPCAPQYYGDGEEKLRMVKVLSAANDGLEGTD